MSEEFTKAFIGVGSNIGEKSANINKVIGLINDSEHTKVIKTSSFYRTEPVGVTDQDWFVNAVIEVETKLDPKGLLDSLLKFEEALGRLRVKKWGPRVIDLDILFYDDIIVNDDGLIIPHPELHWRNFVLEPLCEIAPDFVHPALKKTVLTMKNELKEPEAVVKF